MVNENRHPEVVVRRWREADVRFTAIVRDPADAEQTLYGTATRAHDGTFIGSYYPADLARQNDWHVVPCQGEPFPVNSEPDAVRALSTFSERLV